MIEQREAVVVLGHGSRNPAAQQALTHVVKLLGLQTGWRVEQASLDFNHPTLPEAAGALYEEGFRRLVIAPYLLYAGNHVARDLPALVGEIAGAFPDLEIEIAEPLGVDARIVSTLEARVRQAQGERGAVASGVVPPAEIERKSFEIIEGLIPQLDLSPAERAVVVRVVHATGDPSLASQLVFSPGAVERGVAALAAGRPVVTDVNMVRAGVSPSLGRVGVQAHCLVGARETAERAEADGVTRSVAAIREFGPRLNGAIVAVGNAPTALLETVRLFEEEGIEPALVVGVPVGFVAAAESKEALAGSGLAHVTLPGLRGGTPIAVAVVNALARQVKNRSRQAGRGSGPRAAQETSA
ncbi:MAG: hypothetical protein Kow00122_07810 [Thermoleophilia bacterium]